MQDAKKAKEQRSDELAYLRKRVAELERSERERKRGEERLREKERRIAEFFGNAPIHRFLLLDSALDIVAGNDLLLDLFSTFFGLKREEIIGKNFPELIPGFEASDRHKQYLEVLRTGTPFYTEDLAPPPEAGDVRISVSVFKAGDGLGVIATDITERMRVERALQESEERFRALFEGSLDASFLVDPDSGDIVDANPAASELLLLDHDEIVGLHYTKFYPPRSEADVRGLWAEILEAREETSHIETLVLRSDGQEVPVEGLAQVIQIDGVPFVYGTFRDVSQRKEAEDALRKSEERYRIFFDEAPTALWEIDASSVKEFTDQVRKTGVRDFRAYFEDHPEEAVRCEKKVKLIEMNRASLELFEAGTKEETPGRTCVGFSRERHRRCFQEASSP